VYRYLKPGTYQNSLVAGHANIHPVSVVPEPDTTTKGQCDPIYLSISLSIYLSIYLYMALQPFVGCWPLFQFLDLYTQTIGLL
jgi:hypothetical protein